RRERRQRAHPEQTPVVSRRWPAAAAGMELAQSQASRRGGAMETHKSGRREREAVEETPQPPRRTVIAVGKKGGGRWQVRTGRGGRWQARRSLWRYLATTALSRH